ncbi:MAG: nuclear transport factor 2 family protein [Pseudomonadota bacterium]|nr:nuclear transport factor 2 family protein [Pseudomonadota bacterium]
MSSAADMADLAAFRDHLALEQLAIEYANAIDSREWDRLDRVFTPDAHIDYSATGGIAGPYSEIKAWLPSTLKFFKSYMHLMGNFRFVIDGDSATGQVACFNPMLAPALLGGSNTVIFGIWYHDEYVRMPDGWRIAKRRQQHCYSFNVPLWMRLATKLVAPFERAKQARRARVS